MARGEPLIRQWNLLKTLQAHRFGICADDLAERLEYSKRQVQRDLKVLQQAGFPVSFEERDFGKRYWKLSPHFLESQDLIISVTEMLSLYLSQQFLSPLTGTELASGLATLLDKVKAFLPAMALRHFASFVDTLMVKSLAHPDYSRHDKEIRILNQAMAERRTLKIRYRSASKGRSLDTQFHPYGIVIFGASLYCIGYLTEYKEIRTLKVTRILGLELMQKTFNRPAAFSLQAYTQGSFGIFSSGETQTIKVKCTGWAATNVREQRWHSSQKIIKDTEDHVIVQFELANTTEFMRWTLGFGRHALVQQPKSLATRVADELQVAAGQYDKT